MPCRIGSRYPTSCARGRTTISRCCIPRRLRSAPVWGAPQASLERSPAIDFVAGNEFDFTIKEIAEGRDWNTITGLSYRDSAGTIRHNPPRAILENMDELPFVSPVYKRDLAIENYFIGYLKHPYVSLYTGRG